MFAKKMEYLMAKETSKIEKIYPCQCVAVVLSTLWCISEEIEICNDQQMDKFHRVEMLLIAVLNLNDIILASLAVSGPLDHQNFIFWVPFTITVSRFLCPLVFMGHRHQFTMELTLLG